MRRKLLCRDFKTGNVPYSEQKRNSRSPNILSKLQQQSCTEYYKDRIGLWGTNSAIDRGITGPFLNNPSILRLRSLDVILLSSHSILFIPPSLCRFCCIEFAHLHIHLLNQTLGFSSARPVLL